MVTIEILNDQLIAHIKGIDKFLCFKSLIEIPIKHVESIVLGIDPEIQKDFNNSVRLPGTYIPGLAIGGKFYSHGQYMFWDIHQGHHAITIKIGHDTYSALVVEVENPSLTVAQIEAAISANKQQI